MNKRVSGLYAITPEMTDTGALIRKVEAALRGGAQVIQYRTKAFGAALCRDQAGAIARACRDRNALFIVNDSIELARQVNADGVHLGKEDAEIGAARAAMNRGKLIGMSCYNDVTLAKSAVSRGADYVAFGSFFPSATKPLATRADPEVLRHASELGVPIVAIGGIDEHNAGALIAAGASAIAVINALFEAPDIEAQANRLSRLFNVPLPT